MSDVAEKMETPNDIADAQPSPQNHFQQEISIEDDTILTQTQDRDPYISHKKLYTLWERALTEGIGTFCFIFIALATVNQTVLSAMIGKYEVSQWTIAIGFALGLGSGVYVSGPITGGHLNPAISFTMYVFNGLSLQDMLYYIVAQMLGGFFAALIVFGIYYNSITLFPYTQATAGLFGTLKASQTSIGVGLTEQIVGTAILMMGILFVIRENPIRPNPWSIGGILGGLAIGLGNNGFAFNMARDLAPRLMSAMFWGADVFSYEQHWWWVPIVGSFIGAPLGFCIFSAYETYLVQ